MSQSQDQRPTLPDSNFGSPFGPVSPTAPGAPSIPPTQPAFPVEGTETQVSPGPKTMILNTPAPSLAWLAVLSGIRTGRLFPLDPQGTVLGRDAQCDIILDDTAVSRQHAKLRREPGARKSEQFYIYDLGTSNGTFVNDKKIVRKALVDGDRIRVGETLLVFKNAEAPPATKRTAKKRAQKK